MKSTASKFAPLPDEYTAIAAWGEFLRSHRYYVEQEQRRAVRLLAPFNTISFSEGPDGVVYWVTIDNLPADHPFRDFYARWLEARQAALRG